MSLNKNLKKEIEKGDNQNLNELIIRVLEYVQKNPNDYKRNEELILREINEYDLEELK